jgi:energy-coupling factor transporter ATP-binding protein EcfA2
MRTGLDEVSRDPGRFRAVWRFSPRAGFDVRREEAADRRAGLLSALRAGHGAGAAFLLRLESGPEPGLTLHFENSVSERWGTRVFVPAFPPYQWTREPDPRPRGLLGARLARRIHPWPRALRLPSDGPSLIDHLARAMATVPRGMAVDLEVHPLPASLPGWWEHDPPIGDATSARATLSDGSRGGPPRFAVRPEMVSGHPLFWSLRVAAGSVELPGTARSLPPVFRAIERASRSGFGNGVAFRSALGPGRSGFPVSEDEMVLVLPGTDCPTPGERERAQEPGPSFAFGRTSSGEVVGPTLEPLQGRHVAILGETGMGKSSLLVALARRAARGSGLVLLDPLGETAEALARELPPAVLRTAVCIDPIDRPVRINALEGVGPTERDPVRAERRLNDLVHALRRVRAGRYADSGFWGPRLEEMLTRAVRAAAALEAGTLTDAHTLLATGARLHRDVPADAQAPVRELADRIREHPEDAEGARRLVYEVVRSPVLERMLCARTAELATRELVAPERVVLVSGNAARVGESTARYLLSVYLALIWSELLARPVPAKTFVLLDEAQWFSHESLGEMLRLGRRANVHVVLATQAVASLPDAVAEAVWTNVADFVAFRGSPEEAREFSRAARGVSPEAILSLPRGHAAVLLGKGHAVRWLRTARIPSSVDGGPRREAIRKPFPGAEAQTSSEPPAPSMKVEASRPSPSQPHSGGESTHEPSVAEVLCRIRATAALRGWHGPIRIALDELRREVDPDGRAVRAAGAILGRSGAILSTERSERGAVWVLAPDRIPPPASPVAPATPEEGSSAPQLY